MVIKSILLSINYFINYFEITSENSSSNSLSSFFCILLLFGMLNFGFYLLYSDLTTNVNEEEMLEESVKQIPYILEQQEMLEESVKQIPYILEQHTHIINSLYDLINHFYF